MTTSRPTLDGTYNFNLGVVADCTPRFVGAMASRQGISHEHNGRLTIPPDGERIARTPWVPPQLLSPASPTTLWFTDRSYLFLVDSPNYERNRFVGRM